jgi:hypothetical protein
MEKRILRHMLFVLQRRPKSDTRKTYNAVQNRTLGKTYNAVQNRTLGKTYNAVQNRTIGKPTTPSKIGH